MREKDEEILHRAACFCIPESISQDTSARRPRQTILDPIDLEAPIIVKYADAGLQELASTNLGLQ